MTLYGFIMTLIERNTVGLARTLVGGGLLYGAWRIVSYLNGLSEDNTGLFVWCVLIVIGMSVLGGIAVVTGLSKLFDWD